MCTPDVQVTNLKKLMGDVRSYGEPRISWGGVDRSRQQDTAVDLSPDFRARLCQNLVRYSCGSAADGQASNMRCNPSLNQRYRGVSSCGAAKPHRPERACRCVVRGVECRFCVIEFP